MDRNGKLLVNNNAIYDLWVTYNQVKDANIDTMKLCNLLNITVEKFEDNLNKDWKSSRYRKYKPFVFLRTISPEMYAQFQESLYEFPGFKSYLHRLVCVKDLCLMCSGVLKREASGSCLAACPKFVFCYVFCLGGQQSKQVFTQPNSFSMLQFSGHPLMDSVGGWTKLVRRNRAGWSFDSRRQCYIL